MNSENIFDGITGIREDIVQKAENYQFQKKATQKVRKKPWMKWGTMAACACVCVVVGIMVPIIYNNNMHHKSDSSVSEEGAHSGLQTVENPVYEVIDYKVPEEYEFTTLYVATTSETASYDQHMVSKYDSRFQGKGIRVFSFVEGTENPDINVWYLVSDGEHISQIYFISKSPKSEGKYVTGWTEAGEAGRVLEALSSLTSKEEPMYLVQDNEIIYAIIGRKAHYLPVSIFEPEVSYLPEMDLEGLDIHIIELTK